MRDIAYRLAPAGLGVGALTACGGARSAVKASATGARGRRSHPVPAVTQVP
jgi:hypothetical protein